MVLRDADLIGLVELIWEVLVASRSVAALGFCAGFLLLWRLWRFSLRPLFYPHEPKEYPYWVPCHLFSFLRNSEALFAHARRYFNEHEDVFTITLAGQKAYVVTDPRIVGSVFSNTTSLSFDSFLHDIMLEFGTSEAGIRSILEVPKAGAKSCGDNKSVSQRAHDLQVRQTQGDELQKLGMSVIETFQEMMSNDAASALRDLPLTFAKSSSCVISLKTWIAERFIRAGQRAYFGDVLATIDPTLPSALMDMDDLSWQIFYRYPKICRPRLNKLCDQILSAFRQYLAIPKANRLCAAWFTAELEHQYRTAGLSDEDIATQMLFLYWGINTNISKVGFWMIIHLLSQSELIDKVRQETSPAFSKDNTIIDANHVYRNCPTLNAIWLETLRVSASSTALRGITHDFVLGNKLLRAGNQVLVSARQLHLRPQEFGQDTEHFNHQRFLRQPSLERSPAFRPFGGGPTTCPGRLLAKHMTLNFVALLLRRFDVVIAGPQELPKYEEWKPSIGIMGGQGDLQIRLESRI